MCQMVVLRPCGHIPIFDPILDVLPFIFEPTFSFIWMSSSLAEGIKGVLDWKSCSSMPASTSSIFYLEKIVIHLKYPSLSSLTLLTLSLFHFSSYMFWKTCFCWDRSCRRFLALHPPQLHPISSKSSKRLLLPVTMQRVRRYRRFPSVMISPIIVLSLAQDVFGLCLLTVADFRCEMKLSCLEIPPFLLAYRDGSTAVLRVHRISAWWVRLMTCPSFDDTRSHGFSSDFQHSLPSSSTTTTALLLPYPVFFLVFALSSTHGRNEILRAGCLPQSASSHL